MHESSKDAKHDSSSKNSTLHGANKSDSEASGDASSNMPLVIQGLARMRAENMTHGQKWSPSHTTTKSYTSGNSTEKSFSRKCQRCDTPLPRNAKKFCVACRDKNAARKLPEMFVGVDCESRVMPDGIQRMFTFSFGREDGTSESIVTNGALTAKDVLDWLFTTVVGHYTDVDGKVWQQVPIGYFFGHDTALILKDITGPFQVVHKGTSKPVDRAKNPLCATTHKEGDNCTRVHRFDQKAAQIIMSSEGETSLASLDTSTSYAFASTPKRRFFAEYRPEGDRMENRRTLDVHDVGAAFGGSLERNLDNWKPDLDVAEREQIAWGKQQRKEWGDRPVLLAVAAYSEAECVALSRMSRKLIDTIKRATHIPIQPSRLYGSGSLATAAFKTYGVPTAQDIPDDEHTAGLNGLTLRELAMMDYFGGKIESIVIGEIANDTVAEVDIASAYPHQMRYLPCPRKGHGEWVKRKWGIETLDRRVVGHVRVYWRVQNTLVPPFLIRRLGGYVACPMAGETYTPFPEYWAALDRYGPSAIVATEAVIWEQTCNCENPYAWMEKLYLARQEIKTKLKTLDKATDEYARLDAEQLAIKLVLNSCYGKTAQTRPYGAFTNLTFAAAITSGARAMLNRKAWEVEDAGYIPAYMHTDSVKFILPEAAFSAIEDEGTQLGAWEKTPEPIKDFFVAQPGLAISLATGKGATRGVGKDEFSTAVKSWREEQDLTAHPEHWNPIKVPGKRMLTRKAAIARNKPELAGNFVDHELTVGFLSMKRNFLAARQTPNNPTAWIQPAQDRVPDQATIQDVVIWKTELAKYLAQQDLDDLDD